MLVELLGAFSLKSVVVMITKSEEEYINTAIDLFNNPKKLKQIKEKIVYGKNNSTIFKSSEFCINLEKIYISLVSG